MKKIQLENRQQMQTTGKDQGALPYDTLLSNRKGQGLNPENLYFNRQSGQESLKFEDDPRQARSVSASGSMGDEREAAFGSNDNATNSGGLQVGMNLLGRKKKRDKDKKEKHVVSRRRKIV